MFISQSGIYDLNFRIAAQNQTGRIELSLIENETSEVVGSFNLPTTGGWQSWTTNTHEINLESGVYTLRLRVAQAGFNLNWLEFLYSDSNLNSAAFEERNPYVSVYPNPVNNSLTLKTAPNNQINSIELYDISGRVILTKNEINTSSKKLNLEGLTSGSYFVKIATTKGTITKKIIKY